MASPAPVVFVNNISESAIDFKLLFWEADINNTGSVKSRILSDIYQAISDEGIALPSTQKDLFLHFPDGMPMAVNNIAAEKPDDKVAVEKQTKKNPPDPTP